ncbi:SusC/RagA family TonB-linked outer membrane protein [Chitinophaga sedimenti]|uniref:SusC/RagA family TonB-linked outer membrane protein n=1 Tax=Chitinophaga sedimenti TaxID=2033606 RepID=UPI0020033BAA|nr:SusC/RagA family TonB-linked outer membrane protein [Chitinophaga sedimenti]MCK7556491.1 SusC/RagA family TonB-linked outer membrane protein [Chitinophaga sedimenti]
MIRHKLFLCAVSLLLIGNLSYAQVKRTITGTIRDTNGNPVPFATVQIKGSQTGTIADENGKYTITVDKPGTVLVVSYIGYSPGETTVGTDNSLNLVLNPPQAMNEIVVTAMGIKREARAIGYSAQKVSSVEITKAGAPDISSGLMGKSAGLNITPNNGVQGGSSRIVIRGNNSILGNNQPLIVMDGIQVQNDPVGGTTQTAGTSLENPKDWGSFMNFINPDEVDDITVLKGATAAALYGARGANGVILITTKKGAKRPGLGVDYNYTALFTNAYRFQDVQNEYGYGGSNSMWSAVPEFPTTGTGEKRYPGNYPWDGQPAGDKYQAAGAIPGGYSTWDIFSWYGPAASWGHKLDGTELVWWDGSKRKWSPQPDNRKTFFRTGNTQTHNLSFSGGGDFGTIRVGLTRLDNRSTALNSNYDQNNVNLGSVLNISRKMKAEINVSYTNYNRHNTPDIGSENSVAKFMIHGMSRDWQPIEMDIYKNADGSKNIFDQTSPLKFYPYNNNSFKDLFWNLFEHNQDLTRNQLLGSVKLSADVTPWLNVAGRTSLNYNNTEIESKYSPIDAFGVRGQYGTESVRNQDVNFELFTTLHKDNIVKGLNASFLVGNSALRSRMYNYSAWNNGEKTSFAVPFKYYLANTTGTLDLPKEAWANYNLNSLFGVLDLSYNDYLFLRVTGRNDWSSTLPVATSSYFFPSASLSFVFTEAIQGLKETNWLSFGKLKFSAAESANGANPYQTTYTYNSTVISNYINGTAPATFGGLTVRRYQPNLPPADLLLPQRNKSIEAGLELGFFKNRLNMEVTYYAAKATSQIMSGSLAWSSGANAITFNSGELSNKGVEFIVRATPVATKDFRWNLTLNGAHNTNKVVSLAEGIDKYLLQDLWGNNGVQMYVKVGENYGTIYGYDYTHIDGKRVVKKVLDKNDPTKVVGTQYVTTDDPVAIGNATPKLTGGLSNTFNYKGLSLYVLTDFKLGGDIYSADYAAAIGMGLSPRTLKERNGGGLPYTYPDGTTANHGVTLDGVFEDGKPNTDVVHYMYKYAAVSQGWSNVKMPRSEGIFENSWAKLRELNITYSLPQSIVKRTGIFQGLDVSLIGRNLFYIYSSLPDNLNPEAINGIGNAQGIQWAQYPAMRDFGFSIKARL